MRGSSESRNTGLKSPVSTAAGMPRVLPLPRMSIFHILGLLAIAFAIFSFHCHAALLHGVDVVSLPCGGARENVVANLHRDTGFLGKARKLSKRENANNYVYSLETDCYGAFVAKPGGETYKKNSADPFLQPAKPYECPKGTFCLVDARANWRPFSVCRVRWFVVYPMGADLTGLITILLANLA